MLRYPIMHALLGLLVAASVPAVVADAERPHGYMVIPITGPIGFQRDEATKDLDVLPEGIENALNVAKQRGVSKIVLRFDTPGGYARDAMAITELLHKYADDFDYIAEVEKDCISAGVLLLVGCDEIYVAEKAVIGGATGYIEDADTGNYEVDAKFNSIMRAEIQAANRHEIIPDKLLAAMVMASPEVYAWTDDQGKAHFSAAKPVDVPEDVLIVSDGPKSVAVVTGRQLLRLGIVKPLPGKGQRRPWMAADEKWVEVQPSGERYTRIARRMAWRAHEKEQAEMRGFEYSWQARWDTIELMPEEYLTYKYEGGQTVTATWSSVEDPDYMRAVILFKNKSKRQLRFKFDVLLGKESGWAQKSFEGYGAATVQTSELRPGEQRAIEVIVPMTRRNDVNQCRIVNVGPLE